jgi:hypothetical protein
MQITNSLGQTLNLYPNSALNIERNNPLFNEADKFFADVIYPFKAPPSPSNNLFFKGGHRVEALNEVYQLPVQVCVNGTHFFTGICAYKITNADFDCTLKVNFGAIADKVKNTRLPEIRSNDADYTYVSATKLVFEAYMKTVCQNPGNYNYNFFPIENMGFNNHSSPYWPTAFVSPNSQMNYYDFDNETFKTIGPVNGEASLNWQSIVCPFFKLNYILSSVIKYLGFNPQGAFFTDPEIEKIYIYTRKSAGDFDYTYGFWPDRLTNTSLQNYAILESMSYMPNITVAEFLKQIKERLHLAIDFDGINGTCTVESYATIITNPTQDLKNAVTSLEEISTIQSDGYKVTLKADEQDVYQGKLVNGATVFSAQYALLVGNAKNEVEIECGTLMANKNPIYTASPVTNQPILQNRYLSDNYFEQTDLQNPNTINNWPLRLLRYKSYRNVNYNGTTKYGPVSSGLELGDTDAAYYQFLTGAKTIILNLSLNQSNLSNLKATQPISFITKEGAYIKAIVKKISYQLSDNAKRATAKIEALTLVNLPSVQVKIVQNTPIIPLQGFLFTAYFTQQLHGIKELNISISDSIGGATVSGTITNPTDNGGAGGIPVRLDLNYTTTSILIALKINQGIPKYVLFMGIKSVFFMVDGYYTALLPMSSVLGTDAYWIVF